jgi:hypothetical protein
MWRWSLAFLAIVVPSSVPFVPPSPRGIAADSLLGRWDITIRTPDGDRPSWLELEHSGRDAIIGRFVGIVGSARPISLVSVHGDSLHFAIPHQWENGDGDLIINGHLTSGGGLAGGMIFPDGKQFEWSAVRAPLLHRDRPPQWGAPINLLHANDLGGWRPVGSVSNQWVVSNGVLRSAKVGANIRTERTFTDFKLHIEFRYPPGSNSGVYLRGRHEVQIQDDYGKEPWNDLFAGVYGFIAPNEIAAKRANEWQTYDITLIGRRVTVVANGKRVVCDQDIPGITGGALDSNEGAPGPLLLQGDEGPIEYRNIVMTPAR